MFRSKISIIVTAAALLLGGAGVTVAEIAPAQAATCTATLGNGCGGYDAPDVWPGSNGFNTYMSNQDVGAQSGTTQTATVNSASSWSLQANDQPYGYTGVQTFPDTQQLTNNYSADGQWNGQDVDTPLNAMSSLVINYNESSPSGPNDIYEFAPDIWTNYAGQLGGGSGDIMFWVDTTHVRCDDNGLSTSDRLGTQTVNGQDWTWYRYGPMGGELVGILDTVDHDPATNGTCAQQKSGTVDIKAGLDWLKSNGFINTGAITIGQINTGFEITSAQNSTFSMNSYSIVPVLTGVSPSPTPTPTSPSPTPTETSPTPTPTPTPTNTGPAVAFDSQAGAHRVGTSLSWTQVIGNTANREVLAETTVGVKGDIGCTQSLKLNGVPMTKLAVVHTNNQHDGFMDVWAAKSPAAGTARFTLTTSHCKIPALTAVSDSYSEVSALSAPSVHTGWTTSASGSITPGQPGDTVAAFAAAGSALNAPSGALHSLLENQNDATGAGNSAGAALSGTSVTWPITANDWWATVLVNLSHI